MKFNYDNEEWTNKWRLAKRTINGVSRNLKSATKKAAAAAANQERVEDTNEGD